jgi:F0F1-type ATP synthase membrane subunit a
MKLSLFHRKFLGSPSGSTTAYNGQNFFEYVLEFIRDLSKTQIGEEYGPWVPFIGNKEV